MEIITIECPKCKGRLHVETETEKIFCMYCRAEVVVKKAAGSGESISLESLVKRGFLSLEFSEWDKALESFDHAANIDPEHAMIYVGKLLTELTLKKEESLVHHFKPLDDYVNFEKAIRFADPVLKKRLEGYNQAIKDRIARKKAEEERKKREKEKKEQLEEDRRREERLAVLENKRLAEEAWKAKSWPIVKKVTIILAILIAGLYVRSLIN